MPRRNENARPRDHVGHDRWRASEFRAMSDMVDKKTVRRTPESLSEQIVRDFRRNEGLELYKSLNPPKPISPISRIRPYFRGIRWYQKINWTVTFKWAGLILAGLLIIMGLLLLNTV